MNDIEHSSGASLSQTKSMTKEPYTTGELEDSETVSLSAGGNDTFLHRGLKSRHITMIALGGAVGTGLIIGSGAGLAQAGPVGLLIGYVFVGLLCNIVMTSLGEMATWLPLGSSFPGYATRFVDPAMGFALGWTYFFKYVLSTANQLTTLALVLQYWVPRERVNPGVFIAVFYVTIVAINYFGVRIFGEAEFWLSTVKILVMLGIIILSLVLVCGGGPNHKVLGFTYWANPGAIAPYIMTGSAGRFLSVWNSLTSGVFAYLGTELVGVTVGEAQNPTKTIPRAIKLTFWRITVFYILTIFFLGMLVPYNSKELLFANTRGHTAAASPFVVAIELAGIHTLPGILNGAIMIFSFSAANSDLYISVRTLYGLANVKGAPRIFAKTDARGMPYISLAGCATIALLAFMNVGTASTTVFQYFVSCSTTFGLLTWISILACHISFNKARKAQGVPNTRLAYTSPFGVWGSWFALFFCVLVCLTKGFAVFTHSKSYGNFNYKTFITTYLGIPLYITMYLGYKIWNKTKFVKPAEADLFSGKERVDREERAYLEHEAEKVERHGQLHWFYRTFIGWLF